MREPYSVPNIFTPARIPAPTLKKAQKVGSPSRLASLAQNAQNHRHDEADERQPPPEPADLASRLPGQAPGRAGPGRRHSCASFAVPPRTIRPRAPWRRFVRLTSGRLGGPERIKKNAEAPTVAAASRTCVSHRVSVSSLELSPISKSGIVSPIEQTARTAAVSA